MTLGARIRTARKTIGLTQAQLADLCGMATITIQQYERDKRTPDIEKIFLLAEKLRTTVEYLIGTVDENGYLTPETFGDPDDYEFVKALGLTSPPQEPNPPADEEDIKFALFGGESEITDEMYEEVRQFAKFVRQREAEKKNKKPPQD